ncbi:MAG TPA: hypothetical protein VFB52_12695 [Solirubrobacterales bacterium]|nr:hypothetical protein [Solirubrobacterales bacterium]
MRGAKGECRRLALVCAVVAALTLGLAACGGDDGDSTGASTETSAAAGAPADRDGSGAGGGQGPSAEFEVPGGDNSVPRFGTEASAAQRRVASAVVAGYLKAIAAKDYVAQCRYLDRVSVEQLEAFAGLRPGKGGCGPILGELRVSASGVQAGEMAAPVASLRVKGTRGFALYHGKGGVDYVMPLAREGGEWKVTSMFPVEL